MQEGSVIHIWLASRSNMEVGLRLLRKAGFDCHACADIDALIAPAAPNVGALLIEEEVLSTQAVKQLYGFLDAQPPWSDLPVILLVKRFASKRPRRPWSLWISNLTLVERPVTSTALVSVLQMALKARQRQYEVRDLLAHLQDANQRLEQRVAERTTQLERSNKDLEAFAYIASHDLQEPLRMVTSFMALLQEKYKGQLDDTAQQYIGYSVDGATRMATLIKDLLDFARVTTKAAEPAPVDLSVVVNGVKDNLRTSIEESNALVTVDPLPTVTADRSQMRQLFQNLIGNALKFRVQGRRPEVHIGVRQERGEWVFHVKDNGIGIDAQQHARVFIVFQRLHTREEFPGTGLGLAICRKIVDRHGGHIWVESKQGEGSTFFFTIPGR